jgi:hypothetical protein
MPYNIVIFVSYPAEAVSVPSQKKNTVPRELSSWIELSPAWDLTPSSQLQYPLFFLEKILHVLHEKK